MPQAAVGFVETRGLVGAIQAADAAAKAASVEIAGFEQIGGGLVAVRFTGDVASVQVAVQSAVEAARQVSEVISHHLIPAPHADLAALLKQGQPPVAAAPSGEPEKRPSLAELGSLSVARLRQLVRQTSGVHLQGRQISHATKNALIAELRRVWQEN